MSDNLALSEQPQAKMERWRYWVSFYYPHPQTGVPVFNACEAERAAPMDGTDGVTGTKILEQEIAKALGFMNLGVVSIIRYIELPPRPLILTPQKHRYWVSYYRVHPRTGGPVFANCEVDREGLIDGCTGPNGTDVLKQEIALMLEQQGEQLGPSGVQAVSILGFELLPGKVAPIITNVRL